MTREGDLEAARVQGKRIRTGTVEVRYIASPLHRPRVGVIVPRFGHSAVDRNLVKRRLKELARTELLPTLSALDVVIRAAPSAYGATFDTLREALRTVVRKMPTDAATERRQKSADTASRTPLAVEPDVPEESA